MAKGGAKGGAKKKDQARVQKIVEDKTFGLKNKNKSKKVQQYVKTVEQQAKNPGKRDKTKFNDVPLKTKKEIEAEKKAELNMLFKPIVDQQKVATGVDPKTVLCQFFVKGTCQRGNKCRYSHDKTVVRKVEKIDVYCDVRKEDNMDTWDQDQLQKCVDEKQGMTNKNLQTNIVCKHFLEAIESRKYGWFWECPGGGEKCMYRHALPPGFVLKAKAKEMEEEEEVISLEEILDEERNALRAKMAESGGGTPVTLERFLEWRERRKNMKEKARKDKEAEANKKETKQTKEHRRLLSGREMFVYKPEIFIDDAGADNDEYQVHSSDEDEV